MAYVKQFNKIIKRSSTPIPYRIGFVNDKKMEDETELDAKDVKDLASLWKSPCICGYYGRACRQMNDKADRFLCTGCALAEFIKRN